MRGSLRIKCQPSRLRFGSFIGVHKLCLGLCVSESNVVTTRAIAFVWCNRQTVTPQCQQYLTLSEGDANRKQSRALAGVNTSFGEPSKPWQLKDRGGHYSLGAEGYPENWPKDAKTRVLRVSGQGLFQGFKVSEAAQGFRASGLRDKGVHATRREETSYIFRLSGLQGGKSDGAKTRIFSSLGFQDSFACHPEESCLRSLERDSESVKAPP